jgi:DNA helicase-2/ATP-dependent DNA helicase PcrA
VILQRTIQTLFELSDRKKEILAHAGHLLVHGGPGSGKTTISIIKAELLVSESLRPGQKVLFLSFARATVARVLEALSEHSVNKAATRTCVAVDTYHAFFWRILKTHGYLLGLPRKIGVLTPAGQAVALSGIRHEFGPDRKLDAGSLRVKQKRLGDELRRLAFDEGQVCFDLFADLSAELLKRSAKVRALISTAYPIVILDEFQDTSAAQWSVVQELGKGSTLIALADGEQRIYDFIGADPERLNHFRQRFAPKEVDLGSENHRSAGTDIAHFGNDLLKGEFRDKFQYQGMKIFVFPANENQAFAALKGKTLEARQRLIDAHGNKWSLAILVPTKKMMRHVSDMFRSAQGSMPVISHHAAIDVEGAMLAAEVIAFLLQPHTDAQDFDQLIELLCNFFDGRGGDDPSVSDIKESIAIRKAQEKASAYALTGKTLPSTSLLHRLLTGYASCTAHVFSGNPDDDWSAVRATLAGCGCNRLAEVAEEARNVRFLDRGTELREALSLDWRDNGSYQNALSIARQSFTREYFAMSGKAETGIIVMNMHKAKGKQFDEVIIFEGWPRVAKGKIVSNSDRIVRSNSAEGDLTHARQNFRVSVTRAKERTTILTPKTNPCVLLLRGN